MSVEIRRFVTVDHVDGYVLLVVSARLPVVGHPNNDVVGVVTGRRSVGFIIGSSYESQTTAGRVDQKFGLIGAAPNRVNNGLRFVFVMGDVDVEQGG